MIGFVITVVGTGLALWLTSIIYNGISFGPDTQAGPILIVAAIFGVVNAVIKPVIKLLSLPLSVMTLGLFGLVVNGFLLLLVAWVSDRIDLTFTVGGYPPDFTLDTIIAAVVGAVILGIVSTVLGWIPFVRTSK
jgi:putative membrane protein